MSSSKFHYRTQHQICDVINFFASELLFLKFLLVTQCYFSTLPCLMHVLITQSMPEVNDFNAEQVAWPDRQVVNVDIQHHQDIASTKY